MIYFFTAFFAAAALFSLIAAVLLRRKTRSLMEHLDAMIESAIDGTFSESRFSEEKLSQLESKMYRYLAAGETAQKRVTEEKNAVKTLVSDISHQTKTPIANILLYTQLLAETPEMNGDMKNLVTQIEDQTEKLHFLIAALIKTSRLENGIIKIVPKENSISELLKALDFSAAARRKNICLSIHSMPGGAEDHEPVRQNREYAPNPKNPESPRNPKSAEDTSDGEIPGEQENPRERNPQKEICAFFDFKWTLEAISNLVDNAIKYTPNGGNIRISVREYELFVRVDIADTGIGMTEEETAKIFTRFYRSPRTAEEPGVGIGLYLCREIISMEGGYIKVSSEPEKGSVFSVFLPKQTANLSKL